MASTNTLFAVMDVSNPSDVEAKIATIAPWVFYKVREGQWLIIAPNATTSQEVSDKLGLSGNESGTTGIVLRVENYFGRNYQVVWDWISTKIGADLAATTTA